MSEPNNQGMAKYQKISKMYKEIVDTMTTKQPGHVKNYLNNLAKKIAAKEDPILAEFLDLKSLLENLKQAKGKNPIHYAAAKGDVDIMKYMIENFKIDYQIKDKEGNNPFFTAVEHGNIELMRYFIEQMNISPHSTKEGQISAVHMAANHDNIEILEYLCSKGCDLQKVSIYGRPLNWAVGNRHIKATKFLLQKGCDANGDLTSPAPPPLILAIDFGSDEIYEALLNAPKPADINVRDPQGYSALHVAAEKGNLKIVKQLIQKGADINIQVEGKSPLYLAFENEKLEVVSYLKNFVKSENVQEKLKQAKKKAEQEKIAHPVDKQKAEALKSEGNKLYAQKKYEQALAKYSQGIIYDHQNEIIHRNMAACYLPLHKYQQALEHCHKAKIINAKNVKTLYREAQAYIGLGNLMEATTSLWQCAMLEPETAFFRQEFQKYFQLAKQKHQAAQ